MTRDQNEQEAQAHQEAVSRLRMVAPLVRLSSGLGHEFNNLMQTTIGALQLIAKLIDAGRSPDTKPFVESAIRAAQSAIAINQQLVALADSRPLNPEPLNMSLLVAGISDLLRRSLPRSVELITDLASELWPTRCDPQRAKLAVLDLCFHSLDATSGSRTLVIRTRNRNLADHPVASIDLCGRYVCVEMTCSHPQSTRAVDAATDAVQVLRDSGLEAAREFARYNGGLVAFESGMGRAVATLYLPCFDAVDEAPGHSQAEFLGE
jgi:signal transduction histidine kinase